MRLTLTLFALVLHVSLASAVAPPDPLGLGITRGLRRLEQGAASYISNRTCFSCHHQTLTVAALIQARKLGFRVPDEAVTAQIAFTLETFSGKREQIRKGLAVPGGNTMTAYALYTLQVGGHAADDTTEALVDYLLVRQRSDGSWPAVTPRPPSEGSAFTNAALALEALTHFGSRDATRGERGKRIEGAYQKGKRWLLAARPRDTEDAMFQLRGLVAVAADPGVVERARESLVRQQRPDGSWAQLPDTPGDAYATAGVVLALRRAGLARQTPTYQRAIAYLLRTQTPDGAWLVTTRSRPVQRFFDNGDPGGKNQFISFLATGWATLALLDAVPEA